MANTFMGGVNQLLSDPGGLLAGAFDSTLFNTGIGLLAASGPSTMPVSTGQALAQGLQFAQNARQQAIQNQLLRDRLTAERAPPADLRIMEALGMPLTPEGFMQFNQLKGDGGAGLETLLKGLQIGKLQSERSDQDATITDVAISAKAGLGALDELATIPGGEFFLLNPDAITIARNAITAGDREPTGLLKGLPSAISGIPEDQLVRALDLAETAGKQRSALVTGTTGLSGSGVAGLRARQQSLGERAGLRVQRDMFEQAFNLAKRKAAGAGIDLDFGVAEVPAPAPIQQPPSTTITPQPGVPERTSGLNLLRTPEGDLPVFNRTQDAERALKAGKLKRFKAVIVNGQIFDIQGGP